MTYDGVGILFIFAVYLGDSYLLHSGVRRAFVREPEKSEAQKRNHLDLFYDSIAGRPMMNNEFVIFNRYQCCPMYVVSYNRDWTTMTPTSSTKLHLKARSTKPPFSWGSWGGANYNRKQGGDQWPFLARNLFELMKKDERIVEPMEEDSDEVEPSEIVKELQEEELLAINLSKLCDLGFTDDVENTKLLQKFQNNFEATLDHLFTAGIGQAVTTRKESTLSTQRRKDPSNGNDSVPWTTRRGLKRKASSSSDVLAFPPTKATMVSDPKVTENVKVQTKQALPESPSSMTFKQTSTHGGAGVDGDQDCPICCTDPGPDPSSWKTIPCSQSHKVCSDCYVKMEVNRQTMAGVSHTHIKCPFCNTSSGIEIGTCPDGTMTVTNHPNMCLPGYEKYSTFCIQYTVNQPSYQLSRTAYLPNCPEGDRVLRLLETAWDRRLCFTIGTSMTTGRTETLVWNIHHKTSAVGGVQAHGYPDDTYLQRVVDELKQFGVE